MNLSDSRPEPILSYGFPRIVGVRLPSPPCRVSQVPRLFFPCALWKARLVPLVASPPVAGFLFFGRLATFYSVTRPNRVRLRYGSPVCFPGFHQMDCSIPLRFRYTYERAIYMVNSFQFTRSARLSLVFQSRKARKEVVCPAGGTAQNAARRPKTASFNTA
jgi:hypothetical protein